MYYNANINDSIQLRAHVKSSVEYVDDIENVLSTLKNFKASAICNHRLQVWVG